MSDWREAGETDERRTPKKDVNRELSPTGIGAVRGRTDAPNVDEKTYPDQSFTDRNGRDLTMRTYPSGDRYYVRVFDDQKTPEPPERVSYGDAGKLNLHIERNIEGEVERVRQEDVDVPPSYREAGIGARLLSQCESISRQQNAKEIYGIAPHDDKTRDWYAKRGYGFRKDGQEVYKEL